MDRGVSTVLDVGIACLLVTASAILLVGTPIEPTDPPDADRVGRAILPSTITVQVDGYAVETSVSDALTAATRDGTLQVGIRDAIRTRLRSVARYSSIHATAGGQTDGVDVGSEPGPDAAVDAAVFRIGASNPAAADSATDRPTVVIVVRTWSP